MMYSTILHNTQLISQNISDNTHQKPADADEGFKRKSQRRRSPVAYLLMGYPCVPSTHPLYVVHITGPAL
jgi:hypothetical protein